MKRYPFLFVFLLLLLSSILACEHSEAAFPDFITPNDEYYVTRIGGVPKIDAGEYRLEVKGLVEKPRSFTLEELYKRSMVELPLTVECIGNSPGGQLLSTAIWKGFNLYDFMVSLGVSEKATNVIYRSADGYFASHTMEQVKNNGVMAALYMNGVAIPQLHGFPLRILNPGYYGVKQPGWVTGIEVVGRPIKDYWEERGWDCSPPITADSTIFSPRKKTTVKVNRPLKIEGAAFGGTRIVKVEVTADKGKTWTDAKIVKKMDADNVWIFWEAVLTFPETGSYTVNARATDMHGNVQRDDDPDKYDGNNDWPVLKVKVKK
jgi:hypothetical protein